MECYACSNEATRQCRRCARVFCEVHGGDLCAECLSPASSLPSFNVYRGSLLALLLGSAIALWLIVRPPGSSDGGEVVVNDSPTAAATQIARTRTPRPTSRPAATIAGQATPERATETPEDTSQPYEVLDGDTLLSIAERFAPPGVATFDYATQIAAASGLSSVDDDITPGQILTLP